MHIKKDRDGTGDTGYRYQKTVKARVVEVLKKNSMAQPKFFPNVFIIINTIYRKKRWRTIFVSKLVPTPLYKGVIYVTRVLRMQLTLLYYLRSRRGCMNRVSRISRLGVDEWQATKVTENCMLAYFVEKSKTLKSPASLWSEYSMLKSTLSIKENVDISKFLKLEAFLKRKNDGYKPKRSRVFTRKEM
ncbi:hypothetical protein NQ315_016080 [Exocentrus adspersus]|uniref:Uncharacterized protein n=1 Tax=Exocentrus adspersus TaxID=1586481 RepID=A0AAV8VKM0_9CUCU|nr:hypothetical protein NQ315_016080 [Exocentrus adspersus]